MKILYLSCHETLEFDEVSMFHKLGYKIFSPGAYVNPLNKGDQDMRPSIPGLEYDPDILEQYHRIGAAHPGEDGKNYLTKEFVDNFDVVIIMHIPYWIQKNWGVMRHKRVIWRTIGQSLASTEKFISKYRREGLEIVRYSPREANIPHFAGQDALIRFGKNPSDYGPWNGHKEEVISFCQDMEGRGSHCNYALFEEATKPFHRKLFGPGNNQPGFGMGKVSYSRLQQEMRDNRVYFYTGTHPASYTLNFIEAFLSGIPIVAIGPLHGNSDVWRNHDLYEVHDLIKNGVTGFVSDDVGQLQDYIRQLMMDVSLASKISAAARQEGIRHFNEDMIMNAWKAYLERTC